MDDIALTFLVLGLVLCLFGALLTIPLEDEGEEEDDDAQDVRSSCKEFPNLGDVPIRRRFPSVGWWW